MKRYKVIFENNIPLSAQLIEIPTSIGTSEFMKHNGKTVIQCMNIKGDSESDAIEKANKVIKNIYRRAL